MTTMSFLGFIGMWETVAILAVLLLLFGAKRLPELAKGLGQGIKEFKKASHNVENELNRALEVDEPPPPRKIHPSSSSSSNANKSSEEQKETSSNPK